MFVCKFLNLNNVSSNKKDEILSSFRNGEFMFSTPIRMNAKDTGMNNNNEDGRLSVNFFQLASEIGGREVKNKMLENINNILCEPNILNTNAFISNILVFCSSIITEFNFYLDDNNQKITLDTLMNAGLTEIFEWFLNDFKTDLRYKLKDNESYDNVYFTIFDIDDMTDSLEKLDNDSPIYYLPMWYRKFNNDEEKNSIIQERIATDKTVKNLKSYFGDNICLQLFLRQYLKSEYYKYENELRFTIAHRDESDCFVKYNNEGDYRLNKEILKDVYYVSNNSSLGDYLSGKDTKLVLRKFGDTNDS